MLNKKNVVKKKWIMRINAASDPREKEDPELTKTRQERILDAALAEGELANCLLLGRYERAGMKRLRALAKKTPFGMGNV